MSPINSLRHHSVRTRSLRSSTGSAGTAIATATFNEIEDDFFAREADLYRTADLTIDFSSDDDFSGETPRIARVARSPRLRIDALRYGRVLIVTALVAGGAVVGFVRMAGWSAEAHEVLAAVPATPPRTASALTVTTSPPVAGAPSIAAPPTENAAPPTENPSPPPAPSIALEPAPAASTSIPGVQASPSPSPSPSRSSVAVGITFPVALSKCRAAVTAEHVRQALGACRQALALRPHSPEALALLAQAELSSGHASKALRLATAATSSRPPFGEAYIIIGEVHQESGQRAKARASYQQYLAFEPHGRYAGEVRAILAQGR